MRELALHILDLVQNAIEAGAGKVELEIVEDLGADTLTICVRDNGRGMDENQCKTVIDPFVTSRTTRRIGLGLPLIDMSTRQCDGFLNIDSVVGQGTVVKAVYRHSHIDRPPLGNMVETLKTLLIGNSSLDFHYGHRVGANQFCMRTLELTETLGDVPLTQPDVLEWLNGYLAENFAILYGGVDNEDN